MTDTGMLTSPELGSLPSTERKFIGGQRWRWFGFVVLRWALGLLLLTAAILKIQGHASGALAQNTLLLSPRLQFATIVSETLLGIWLLSGHYAIWSRWIALAFFGVLAAVSLSLGLQGQSSCHCFGRITVSPWATFGLDVVAVVALAIFRPRRSSGEAIRWGSLRLDAGWDILDPGVGRGHLVGVVERFPRGCAGSVARRVSHHRTGPHRSG